MAGDAAAICELMESENFMDAGDEIDIDSEITTGKGVSPVPQPHAVPRPKRPTVRSLRSLEEVVSLYRSEGRLPSGNARSPRERALRSWLSRRRQESEGGTLSDLYRRGLREIPGWDAASRQKERYDAEWDHKLAEVVEYIGENGHWPLPAGNGRGETERLLASWLRNQRRNYFHGKLRPERAVQLDTQLPGWRAEPSG